MNWLSNLSATLNVALTFIVLLVAILTIYMLIRCIKRPRGIAILAFGFQLFVLTFGIMSIFNKVISVPLFEMLIIIFGILVPSAFLLYDYISMKKKIKKNNTDIPLIEKVEKHIQADWQYESYLEQVENWDDEIKSSVIVNSLSLEDRHLKNNIVQQLRSVHKLIDNSEYKKAVDIYTILAEILSHNPLIIYNTAFLNYKNKFFSEAIQYYKRALALPGKESYDMNLKALIHFGYGCSLYALKNYIFAINQFNLAKEEYGELKEADVNIAKCYIAIGEVKEAQRHIREALKYKKDNKLSYILARLCYENGEKMESQHQLEAIIEKDSEFDEAWQLLGELYRKNKDWASALRVYKKLTKLNPDDPEAYYRLATSQRHEGKTEEALSNFKFTVELLPEHSRALYCMASIYDAAGKSDKAIECLEKSLEGTERLEMAYNLLAEIFISTDKLHDATKVYKKAILEHSDSYLLHYNLGISLMMLRRYEESVRVFARAQKLNKNDTCLYYNWACAEISLKNYSGALALYKEGLKLESDDDEILFGLARVSALSADVDATIGFLIRAFEINPSLKLRAKASHEFSAFRTHPEFMKITMLPIKEE